MQWTWTWANSREWWGTGRPGILQSMGSQSRPLGDWTTNSIQLTFLCLGNFPPYESWWWKKATHHHRIQNLKPSLPQVSVGMWPMKSLHQIQLLVIQRSKAYEKFLPVQGGGGRWQHSCLRVAFTTRESKGEVEGLSPGVPVPHWVRTWFLLQHPSQAPQGIQGACEYILISCRKFLFTESSKDGFYCIEIKNPHTRTKTWSIWRPNIS